MPRRVSASVDGRLQDLVVEWARRRWPVLRIVPVRLIRPAVAPMTTQLRRVLSRAVLATALSAGMLIMLLALKP
jgi:hypothetical protein